MRKRLIAAAAVAGLVLIGVPSLASAVTHTLSDQPGAPIGVDESSITREFTVDSSAEVERVTVAVDFATHDGEDCAAETGPGGTYPDELGIALTSPAGTRV